MPQQLVTAEYETDVWEIHGLPDHSNIDADNYHDTPDDARRLRVDIEAVVHPLAFVRVRLRNVDY